MTDKIRAYLQAGEALENRATPGPWTYSDVYGSGDECIEPDIAFNNSADGGGFNRPDDMIFAADARSRLRLYRKALEAVLNEYECGNVYEDHNGFWISKDDLRKAIEAVFSEAEAKE